MAEPDDHNATFKLAADFVNFTDRSIFLTGKAGSGKTTFLRHIASHTPKKCVVVAPTGVAAINAGGVTMHSFFQLPFGPYLPGSQRKFNGVEVADKHSLLRNIRFGKDKLEIIDELELLIIDEVSMVRCDMLDAVDTILRHFRRTPDRAFGGLQVLYIGDLFQLPPVARQEDWEILKDHYEGTFFFHSRVVRDNPPLYIELRHIYRQTDLAFIELLNRIRNNRIEETDLKVLNGRYDDHFVPPATENYITLCTHNYKADAVNAAALAKLSGPLYRFRGSVTGEFSDKALPTDMELQLKEGAQVMFIRNDSDPQRRYYNGKIAVIKSIKADEINVVFPDNGEKLQIDQETWVNVRYSYDRESESIEEEEIGSFKQFPIRLAWAITIHKSQGLTFKNAIIDAGSAFAAGQVYVALSRCTSLEGMWLHSRINQDSISTDPQVIAFASREQEADELERLLSFERQRYGAGQLLQVFDFRKTVSAAENFLREQEGKKLPDPEAANALGKLLVSRAREKQEVANKFLPELTQLISAPEWSAKLEDRVRKAIAYFAAFFMEEMIKPLGEHEASLGHASRAKKYLSTIGKLKNTIVVQLEKLRAARLGEIVFSPMTEKDREELQTLKKATARKKEKAEKGNSLKETFALYRAGKTMDEIVKDRHLARSTVEGHLAQLVKSGDLDIRELMNEERLQRILAALESGVNSLTQIKHSLGDDFSYAEIRAVIGHTQLIQSKTIKA